MCGGGIAPPNVLGKVYGSFIVVCASWSIPDNERTVGRAVADVVEPLAAFVIEHRLDASGVDIHTLLALDVDVGTVRHTITVVAGELVHADLIALGLCIDTGGESGEQRAQQEWDEASHGGMRLQGWCTVSGQMLPFTRRYRDSPRYEGWMKRRCTTSRHCNQ
jgi:uncharacterized protein YggT (Ycf19 family)